MIKQITIPVEVRSNKAISASAKLLYGEILALASDDGVCVVENDYLAGVYNVDERSIRNWINELEAEKLIKPLYVNTSGGTRRDLLIRRDGSKFSAEPKGYNTITFSSDVVSLKFND